MPRSTTNFDTVRKIGLALPGVEESTAYGSPALKVHGKLLACVPSHRSAEPGSLCVWQPDDFVFTREDGGPITDFRVAWWNACIRAGLGRFQCRDCQQTVTA